MKLGVFTPVLYHLSFEDTCKYLSESGVQALEVGAGGYPGKTHFDPEKIIGNDAKVKEIKDTVAKYNLEIAAISCHGNPIHPQKEIAEKFHNDFKNAILLAELLGVETIIGFSGCPGDCPESKYPNWVVTPWPEDFGKILEYQWNDVLIPYWKEMASFAKAHGIKKIAFELHPGFMVYNPETLLRLREAVGDIIGANFDPSHLFWQGINPVTAVKELRGAIYHFHAKDTKIDERNTAVNGVLDYKSHASIAERAWLFRTVGYGHGKEFWNELISMLRTVGYDGVISIEHEDALMSPEEGLQKAIAFLKEVLIFENAGDIWWA